MKFIRFGFIELCVLFFASLISGTVSAPAIPVGVKEYGKVAFASSREGSIP
jgi:hypothetical protein